MTIPGFRILLVGVFGLGLLFPPAAGAQTLTVAAAADLQFAMQDIAWRFQKETGTAVKVVYGSSGNFLQQLRNGGPFDLFFSANVDYAKQLEAAGLAEPGSLYEYATGKIVLWVRNDSKVDLAKGLRGLASPSVRKIAIANPDHAPYGQAALAAMRAEGVYDQVSGKFVLGENISQAASFALSGAADVGVLALSLVVSPNLKDKGRYIEVPPSEYPPIRQACVVVKSSPNKKGAEAFVNYVKTPAIAELLKSYGFGVPEKNGP